MASSSEILVILNATGLQSKDPRLYQVLQALVTNLGVVENRVTTVVASTSSTGSTGSTNAITALSGDVSATGPGAVVSTLSTTGVVAGTYGDSTHVPVITV